MTDTHPLGVDESNNNGVTDPAAHARQLVADGVRFVMLKVTEGLHFTDPTWHARRAAYEAAGLYVGGYHFAHPDLDPVEQARAFLTALGGLRSGDLPPALDLETVNGRTPEQLRTFARIFLAYLRSHTNREPTLYTYSSYLRGQLGGVATLGPVHLWVADYGVAQSPSGAAFWQGTDRQRLPGIGTEDGDRFIGTEAQLAQLAHVELAPAHTRGRVLIPCPPAVRPGDHGDDVRRVQGLLYAAGQHPGTIDGVAGDLTIAAVRRVQALAHLPVTGRVDVATWRELLGVAR